MKCFVTQQLLAIWAEIKSFHSSAVISDLPISHHSETVTVLFLCCFWIFSHQVQIVACRGGGVSSENHLDLLAPTHLTAGRGLKSRVQEILLRLKNVRLRFSFWAHMLLSWVSVIIPGALKWKHLSLQMNLAYGPLDVGYTKWPI